MQRQTPPQTSQAAGANAAADGSAIESKRNPGVRALIASMEDRGRPEKPPPPPPKPAKKPATPPQFVQPQPQPQASEQSSEDEGPGSYVRVPTLSALPGAKLQSQPAPKSRELSTQMNQRLGLNPPLGASRAASQPQPFRQPAAEASSAAAPSAKSDENLAEAARLVSAGKKQHADDVVRELISMDNTIDHVDEDLGHIDKTLGRMANSNRLLLSNPDLSRDAELDVDVAVGDMQVQTEDPPTPTPVKSRAAAVAVKETSIDSEEEESEEESSSSSSFESSSDDDDDDEGREEEEAVQEPAAPSKPAPPAVSVAATTPTSSSSATTATQKPQPAEKATASAAAPSRPSLADKFSRISQDSLTPDNSSAEQPPLPTPSKMSLKEKIKSFEATGRQHQYATPEPPATEPAAPPPMPKPRGPTVTPDAATSVSAPPEATPRVAARSSQQRPPNQQAPSPKQQRDEPIYANVPQRQSPPQPTPPPQSQPQPPPRRHNRSGAAVEDDEDTDGSTATETDSDTETEEEESTAVAVAPAPSPAPRDMRPPPPPPPKPRSRDLDDEADSDEFGQAGRAQPFGGGKYSKKVATLDAYAASASSLASSTAAGGGSGAAMQVIRRAREQERDAEFSRAKRASRSLGPKERRRQKTKSAELADERYKGVDLEQPKSTQMELQQQQQQKMFQQQQKQQLLQPRQPRKKFASSGNLLEGGGETEDDEFGSGDTQEDFLVSAGETAAYAPVVYPPNSAASQHQRTRSLDLLGPDLPGGSVSTGGPGSVVSSMMTMNVGGKDPAELALMLERYLAQKRDEKINNMMLALRSQDPAKYAALTSQYKDELGMLDAAPGRMRAASHEDLLGAGVDAGQIPRMYASQLRAVGSTSTLLNNLDPGVTNVYLGPEGTLRDGTAGYATLQRPLEPVRSVFWNPGVPETPPPAMRPPPKPMPPGLSKTVPPDGWKSIDDHVMELFDVDCNTFAEQVNSLCGRYQSDVEKCRAIFRFLTARANQPLSYDPQAPVTTLIGCLRAVQMGEVSPHELFKRMCAYAGFHCEILHGYSKGAGYRPGMNVKDNRMFRNTWTAVYVEGCWRFVNVAWGGRRLRQQGGETTLRLGCDNFYFLTEPDEHIFEHYPDEKRWQLLRSPIALSHFMKLPLLKSPFFNAGMRLKKGKYDDTLVTQNGRSA
ncbi:hypothetical protein BOX15_Mlig019490g1 [Macrostomum lignano]|uniref:Transglutaminase-like domain-containing protein n=1 Tax=Macrostomum lignano TaxID=282301 RepID=A0A267DE47_9PLAT|nr:hypothetical protein BOX15_Mlig019490g1 [Macrostomum lignano]